MENWPRSSSVPRNSATMIFGGVPISVIRPPRIEAKESGIKVSAGERLALRAAWMSTGIKRASAATLFMTADRAADRAAMMPIWAVSLREASMKVRVMISTAPEADRPRLTISTRAMITVAGWPNPENAFSAGTAPSNSATTRAENATRS